MAQRTVSENSVLVVARVIPVNLRTAKRKPRPTMEWEAATEEAYNSGNNDGRRAKMDAKAD